jgi:hypothetical protein
MDVEYWEIGGCSCYVIGSLYLNASIRHCPDKCRNDPCMFWIFGGFGLRFGYKQDKTSQRRTLIECFDVVLIVGWLDVRIVTHSSIQQNLSLIQTSNFSPSRSVTKIVSLFNIMKSSSTYFIHVGAY